MTERSIEGDQKAQNIQISAKTRSIYGIHALLLLKKLRMKAENMATMGAVSFFYQNRCTIPKSELAKDNK